MEKLRIFASKSSLLVLLIITIFLSGCYTAHSSNIQITPAPTCEPDTPRVYQIYQDKDIPNKSTQYSEIAKQIYDQAFATNVHVANLAGAQQEAFRFLKYQTKRWTRVENLSPDGEPEVRTIVIFLSPDLIRAVLLNHMLFKFDPNQDQNLENYVGSNLDRFKKANELVFMLIVQSEVRENKTFTISPQNIILNNTSVGLSEVRIVRRDSILDQALPFTDKAHAGYFYYPIGTKINGECAPSINPEKDTNITLTTKKAIIGNTQNIAINWSFCFCSILLVNDTMYEANFAPDATFTEKVEPKNDLPAYNFDINDDSFYTALSKFIWAKMISEEAIYLK